MSESLLLTKAQVAERFGWSKRTITRRVKQGCFPCYRENQNTVRFKEAEILYYIEGIRQGSFSGGAS